MLHLVFSTQGLQKVKKGGMRSSDQVIKLSKDTILLLDVAKYLQDDNQVEGEVIDRYRLASIIDTATSIKTTY